LADQNLSPQPQVHRHQATHEACRIGLQPASLVAPSRWHLRDLVHWDKYLAPWLDRLSPFTAHDTMLIVGVIEIVAGLAIAFKPRYGAYIVAAWLAGIVINLLTFPGFYDVALRDFGLLLSALTLARLASVFDPAWKRKQ
jgi:hypothetical protein